MCKFAGIKLFFEKNKFEFICIFVVLITYVGNKYFFIPFLVKNSYYLFFSYYFNDLLCPLLFLPACQIVLKWTGVNVESYWLMLLLILIGGLTWEYLIPYLTNKRISDPIDLIFYFLGMNFYYALRHEAKCIIKRNRIYKEVCN